MAAMALLQRAGTLALLALPAALIVYFSFNAGGYFPDSVGFGAIIVLQALVLRTTLSEQPVAGFRPLGAVIAAAMAALTLWILVSGTWGDATGRALIEADRALLYLLVFVLFASVPRDAANVRWMTRGVAAALVGICVVGLVTRLLPETFPVDLDFAADRLSYPVTYWNALGLMGAIALVLCLCLGSDRAEPAVVRTLAVAAVPALAVTILFTFSRGAIVVTVAGVIVFLILTRGGRQLAALVATAPPTAIALVIAYDAEQLSTTEPTNALAVEQGHHVAIALAVAVVAAAVLHVVLTLVLERLRATALAGRAGRIAARAAWGVTVIAILAFCLAVEAPSRLSNAVDEFFNGAPGVSQEGDLRERLVEAASNGRVEQWEVALDSFSEEPLTGNGAASFGNVWSEDRPLGLRVVDAHSLYLEALAEYGVVGCVLLVIVLAGILGAFAMRLRGPNRVLYAGLLAAGLTWCARAAADWDWEMPVTAVWLFALGGAAAAARARRSAVAVREAPPGGIGRWAPAAALGWLAIAAAPLLVTLSQSDYGRAEEAFARGDCRTATEQALDSIATMSSQREPYEIIGFCDARAGSLQGAVAAMEKAVQHEPANWEGRYALALAQGQAGQDPRPELARAMAMNPRESTMKDAFERLLARPREQWPSIMADAQEAAVESGQLTVADQFGSAQPAPGTAMRP